MKTTEFIKRLRVQASAREVFDWHTRPGAFERLSPPWGKVEVLSRTGTVRDGDELTLRMKTGPLSRRWVARHFDYREGVQFTDQQKEGPFAFWKHTHSVQPEGADICTLEDRIEYALPLGVIGDLLAGRWVRRELEKVFHYRHIITALDIESHRKGGAPMKIAVSGASGFIGSHLLPFLTTGGHDIRRLVRKSSGQSGEILWNPGGSVDRNALEGLDAVVHLAGENISQRWTAESKARMRDSRAVGTRSLCDALASLAAPPRVLVCASATGYYGNRGGDVLTEESGPGEGFLSDVCVGWERATEPAAAKGIRVVNLRIGIILHPGGGALQKMLLPFKLGVGGNMGSGNQYWSWVALDDVISAIHHALTNESLQGPVNMTSPNPSTNSEFTRTLARVLKRPALFPVPAFAARLALGEMSDALLMASARVHPARLLQSGYEFQYPELEGALRHLLG